MDMRKTLTRDALTKILTSLWYSTSIWHYWILIEGTPRAPQLEEEKIFLYG